MSRPSAEKTSLLGASSPEGSQGSATSRATHESSDVTRKVAEEPKVTSEEQRRRMAIDITSENLRGRLNIQNVADLVLLSMVRLSTPRCLISEC